MIFGRGPSGNQLAWEEFPELAVVNNEGHDCAKADDTVRVRPKEVVAARVEVGLLDHADREVVNGMLVVRKAAHRTVTARQEGKGLRDLRIRVAAIRVEKSPTSM